MEINFLIAVVDETSQYDFIEVYFMVCTQHSKIIFFENVGYCQHSFLLDRINLQITN